MSGSQFLSLLITFELVGPRFESMTRIHWRRLRQDAGVVKSPVVWQLKAHHIMIDPQDLP